MSKEYTVKGLSTKRLSENKNYGAVIEHREYTEGPKKGLQTFVVYIQKLSGYGYYSSFEKSVKWSLAHNGKEYGGTLNNYDFRDIATLELIEVVKKEDNNELSFTAMLYYLGVVEDLTYKISVIGPAVPLPKKTEDLDDKFEKAMRSHIEKQKIKKCEPELIVPSVVKSGQINISNKIPLVIVVEEGSIVSVFEHGKRSEFVQEFELKALMNKDPEFTIKKYVR